jgi:hypothetical protein
LRVARQTLFEARHPDEDESEIAFIENGAQLFEAGHLQAIGLIDDDELCGIKNGFLSRRICLCHSSVDRIRPSHTRLPAIGSNPLSSANFLELSFLIAAERFDRKAPQVIASDTDFRNNLSRGYW